MSTSGDRNAIEIAIIGAGEMGAGVARRLSECGARVATSLKGRSAASVERMTRAGIEITDDDARLVDQAHFVMSIVPPAVACEVAQRYRDPIRSSKTKPFFVDCNAIAPATARRIDDILRDGRFIDAGIIGGPPTAGTQDPSKGPRFYASGESAKEMLRLSEYGLDIAVLDGPIGAASALKLSYAGMTKGFVAITTAMVHAASREGLADALRAELMRTLPNFLARLERAIPDMFGKAYRWVAEMEQIGQYIGDAREGGAMYDGMARLYEWIASELARGDSPDLEALKKFCAIK
ncbi:MAG TPA: DUF1932 domain-containing protein [Candidatus Binataceae bacterium]|nr:DUF1932 domain-containing protein [Candidatus Binataceae bacterium]